MPVRVSYLTAHCVVGLFNQGPSSIQVKGLNEISVRSNGFFVHPNYTGTLVSLTPATSLPFALGSADLALVRHSQRQGFQVTELSAESFSSGRSLDIVGFGMDETNAGVGQKRSGTVVFDRYLSELALTGLRPGVFNIGTLPSSNAFHQSDVYLYFSARSSRRDSNLGQSFGAALD